VTLSCFNWKFLEKQNRRGPKPDTKPPLTRKQELNRQAQRTHRERKERYVKTLEEEIDRLRNSFTAISKEREQILEENRRLRELLALHNIVYNSEADKYTQDTGHNNEGVGGDILPRNYDEIGIDFVLSLERPCMNHIKAMTSTSVNDSEADYHGHALCVSCPPQIHSAQFPEADWDLYSRDIKPADLSILFNLSNRLQLEGEMTPIAVWATITRHKRFPELELSEFETIKQNLLPKIKCYGFGSVIEAYQVRDTLDELLNANAQLKKTKNKDEFHG
jgi:regulator of replication initiation timing